MFFVYDIEVFYESFPIEASISFALSSIDQPVFKPKINHPSASAPIPKIVSPAIIHYFLTSIFCGNEPLIYTGIYSISYIFQRGD